MSTLIRKTAFAAASAAMLATAMPAAATGIAGMQYSAMHEVTGDRATGETWQHNRGRRWNNDNGYRGGYRYASEPVYSNTRVWRGRDGRYYCRKRDGTTGLLIGGAVGGLIGHEVAGRGDRTLGVVLGAAGGALLGRAIDRSNSRCR